MKGHDIAQMSLKISRETYSDITDIPHFIVSLSYAGHYIDYEDIYFDNVGQIVEKLRAFKNIRSKKVLLDGGMRMTISLEGISSGAAILSFHMEQFEPSFPGECILKGSFSFDDSAANKVIDTLEQLFLEGKDFYISG